MNDAWALWLVLVGLAVGLATAWLLLVRLPRDESDVGAAERHEEAAWISQVIERHGGVAPVALVDEVLGLHQVYLRDPRRARDAAAVPPGGPGLSDEVGLPAYLPPPAPEVPGPPFPQPPPRAPQPPPRGPMAPQPPLPPPPPLPPNSPRPPLPPPPPARYPTGGPTGR